MKGIIPKIDCELIKVYIEYNKQVLKIKFPADTRILQLEEYLKRTMKISPI